MEGKVERIGELKVGEVAWFYDFPFLEKDRERVIIASGYWAGDVSICRSGRGWSEGIGIPCSIAIFELAHPSSPVYLFSRDILQLSILHFLP